MTRCRFSLAALFGLVTFSAVGFAAVRSSPMFGLVIVGGSLVGAFFVLGSMATVLLCALMERFTGAFAQLLARVFSLARKRINRARMPTNRFYIVVFGSAIAASLPGCNREPDVLGGPVAVALSGEDLERGYVGLSHETASTEQARAMGIDGGVVVTSVLEGGPADAAGIAAGDVIVAIGEAPVTSREDVETISRRWKPDETVRFHLVRQAEEGVAVEVRLVTFQRMIELSEWSR